MAVVMMTVITLLFAGGCNRVNHDGPVDGYWMVESIETKSDGSMRYPDRHMVCVQLEIMQLRAPFMLASGEIMAYDKETGVMTVDFRSGNIEPEALANYGIYENPVTFHVDADRKKLILTTPTSVIKCKRY